MPTARTPAPPPSKAEVRANLHDRCAALTARMADLDPAGAEYTATDMRRDQCLETLFKLGPLDPWGDPD